MNSIVPHRTCDSIALNFSNATKNEKTARKNNSIHTFLNLPPLKKQAEVSEYGLLFKIPDQFPEAEILRATEVRHEFNYTLNHARLDPRSHEEMREEW